MHRDTSTLIEGGLGGATATVIMSLFMLAARRASLIGELPPERMTNAVLRGAGLPVGRRTQDVAAALAHLLFGSIAGTLFGLLHGRLRLPLTAAAQGSLYGVMVWFVSYMGWIPAAGLMPPATRDEPRRPPIMVLAHLIYGATLGTFVGMRAAARAASTAQPAASSLARS